jgi:hypothetical protein
MLRETGKILGDLETGQEVNEVLLKSSLALATSLFGRNFSFNPTSHNPVLEISVKSGRSAMSVKPGAAQ